MSHAFHTIPSTISLHFLLQKDVRIALQQRLKGRKKIHVHRIWILLQVFLPPGGWTLSLFTWKSTSRFLINGSSK